MRAFGWTMVALVTLLAGCLREPAGPTWDWDQEADREEAEAFLRKYEAYGRKGDSQSRISRSSLALQALSTGFWRKVPGCTSESLHAQGLADAEAAARELPNNPMPPRLIAGFMLWTGNLDGAVQAACRAADLAPRSAGDWEACGDLLRQSGDGPAAVERYKRAVVVSTDRAQQFDLIRRIQNTSLQPSQDLASLPPELVEQYRAGGKAHGTTKP